MADAFATLVDPTRRLVVEHLGRRPYRAGELAVLVGTSAPVMSRHLRMLLKAGMIIDERVESDARVRVFRLRREPLTAVQDWLDLVQANWTKQLESFKAHVDQRYRA